MNNPVICDVLEFSTSGNCASLKREPSEQQQRRETIAEEAQQAYHESGGIYGYRKVHDSLDTAKELRQRDAQGAGGGGLTVCS